MTAVSLSEFLLARYAGAAERIGDLSYQGPHWGDCDSLIPPGFPCDCGLPALALADIESHRLIVGQWDATQPPASGADYAVEQELELVLMHLALPYADHPDYRPEWSTGTLVSSDRPTPKVTHIDGASITPVDPATITPIDYTRTMPEVGILKSAFDEMGGRGFIRWNDNGTVRDYRIIGGRHDGDEASLVYLELELIKHAKRTGGRRSGRTAELEAMYGVCWCGAPRKAESFEMTHGRHHRLVCSADPEHVNE